MERLPTTTIIARSMTKDDLWSAAMDCAGVGAWHEDLVEKRCFYSAAWKRMLGYGPDELGDDGNLWLALIHPDDIEQARLSGERHLSGETGFAEAEFRLRHKEGHWIWVLDRGRIVERDADGRPTRMAGAQIDITAQKQAEAELALTNERIKLALDAGGIGLWEFDSETRTMRHDHRISDIFGISRKEAGRPAATLWRKRLHPDDMARAQAALSETLKSGTPMSMSYRIVRAGGEVRHVRALARRIQRPDAEPLLVGSIWDITDQVERESRVKASREEYRALFDNAVIGIYRSTPAGRMLTANPALVRLNGYDSEADLVSSVNDIATEWYVEPGRRDEFKTLLHEHGIVTDFVSEVYRHKTRERIWISECAWAVRDRSGEIVAYEGSIVEATERKRVEQENERMARRDALTGLANRRLMTESLEAALARMDGRSSRVAVLCLDLDRFKAVNDAFGHPVGDELLVEAGRRLQEACRQDDVIARIGGDEFTVVCGRIAAMADAEALAMRILDAFDAAFHIGGRMMVVHTSIGIAMAPEDGLTGAQLIENADAALYRAKAAGKNRYETHRRRAVNG